MEEILRQGCRARDILDNVKIFFNFLLAKMTSYGVDVTDLKMLWHLLDKNGVSEGFQRALKSFGFHDSDMPYARLLLATIYKLQVDIEREVSIEHKTGIAEIEINECLKLLETKLCMDDLEFEQVKRENSESDMNNVSPNDVIQVKKEITCKTGTQKNDERKDDSEKRVDSLHDTRSVTKEVHDVVRGWHIDAGLRKVITRMLVIVTRTLNAGKQHKRAPIPMSLPEDEQIVSC